MVNDGLFNVSECDSSYLISLGIASTMNSGENFTESYELDNKCSWTHEVRGGNIYDFQAESNNASWGASVYVPCQYL